MLALFGCAILLFDFLVFPSPKQRKYLLIFVALGLGFAGYGLWQQQSYLASQGVPEITAFGGALVVDGFSLFFNWIFLIASLHRRDRLLPVPGDRRRAPRRILRPDSAGQLRHVLPGGRAPTW